MPENDSGPSSEKPIKQIPPMFDGSRDQLVQELRTAADLIQIQDIQDSQWNPIAEYCLQLWSWNQNINLTRHVSPELFVKRDLLDAWQLSKLLEPNEEILDVGSGGGVPGILVCLLRPDIQVSLCDSVAKKANVLNRMVEHLSLSIPVHPMSVQNVLEDFRFDSLTARAVGPLVRLCTWLKEDWHKFGRLLAIKGPKWIDERGEARHRGVLKNVELRRVAEYPMPDTKSNSTILQLRRIRT